MSFRQNLSSIREAAAVDMQEASLGQKISLGATAMLLAIDIPGHEAILGMSASYAYESSHHNPLYSGLAAGAASFAVELGLSQGAATSANSFPEAVKAYRKAFLEDKGIEDQPTLTAKDDAFFALAFGAAPLVVKKHTQAAQTEEKVSSVKRDRLVGLKGAAFLGAFNTTLAVGVTGIALAGEAMGAEAASAVVIDVAKNPLTYLGLFAAQKIISRRSKRAKSIPRSAQPVPVNNYSGE